MPSAVMTAHSGGSMTLVESKMCIRDRTETICTVVALVSAFWAFSAARRPPIRLAKPLSCMPRAVKGDTGDDILETFRL